MEQIPEEILFSNAEKGIHAIKQAQASPEQWLGTLRKNGYLKAEEDKWLHLSDWLKSQMDKKKLSKEEIIGYIAQNKIRIEETILDANNNGLEKYSTAGIENCKELIFSIPNIESWNADDEIHYGNLTNGKTIAWIRFGEVVDTEKILIIDEIQSARHQNRRMKDADIPDAPFSKNWYEMAMKRIIRYAAEQNYTQIVWTTGDQQNERYEYSIKLDRFLYSPQTTTLFPGSIILQPHNYIPSIHEVKNLNELEQIAGKKIAKEIEAGKREWKNIKIGNDELNEFYDFVIPNFINKYCKKWGIHTSKIHIPKLGVYMHGIPVNEKMKEAVLNGQAMFKYIADHTSSFAQKHGFDEKDVKKYADSMRIGNLAGASYAFQNIKRKVRLEHSDKSLGEFIKIFAPIQDELYENFGSIDELREEYVQKEMERRNVMEAARKRAEEESEAERKRLEEFEVMSDEHLDSEYFKAIKNNDENRMRDLVNEAARRNGYISSDEFRMAHRAPSYDEEGIDKSMVDVANNRDQIRESLNELLQMNRDRNREESAEAIKNAISAIDKGEKPTVKIYRTVPKSLKESKVRNGDWVTLSESYAKQHGNHALEGNYRIIEEKVPAENLYWDGNDINEWGYDDRSDYRYRNTKNNRKLNDLITRDDNGDVIPLSQRFNSRKSDPRFRFIGERGAANLDKAEEATTRLDNLNVAREMEEAGKDAKAIKLATGWERGADGKWRYETEDALEGVQLKTQDKLIEESRRINSEYINAQIKWQSFYDNNSDLRGRTSKKNSPEQNELIREKRVEAQKIERELNANARRLYDKFNESFKRANDGIQNIPLGNVLGENHPLFAEYPEMKDIKVSFYPSGRYLGSEGSNGYYLRKDNSIYIDNAVTADKMRSTLAHEIQHAIQNIEGFEQGANEGYFKRMASVLGTSDFDKSVYDINGFISILKGDLYKNIGEVIYSDRYTDFRESLNAEENETLKTLGNMYKSMPKDAFMGNYNYSLEKVKDSFLSPFEKYRRVGGEVEARNVQSRLNMTPEERQNSLASETEDVAREDQLFLHDALGVFASMDNPIEEVDKRFNEELEAFEKGEQKGDLHLGLPGNSLLASGLSGTEMYITPKTLKEHLDKHSLKVDDIKNLPSALRNPLLVYEWGDKAKSLVVITNIEHGNERITAAIKLERNGKRLEVNELASVHPKEGRRFVNEMTNAKRGGLKEALKYVPDKKKALDWLGLVPPEGTASLTDQELSIANVIKNFENPTVLEGEISSTIDELSDTLGVKVNKVKSRKDLPKGIQLEMRGNRYPGLFDSKTGEVYIVMNEITDTEEAKSILHKTWGENKKKYTYTHHIIQQEIESKSKKLGAVFQNIKLIQDKSLLPDKFTKKMNLEGRYPGLFDTETGDVYLIINEISSIQEVEQILLHEVLGHKGIRALKQDKLYEFLDQVYQDIPEAEKTNYLRKHHGNRYIATEEYIADKAEDYHEPKIWDKIKYQFKNCLKNWGFTIPLSDKDIRCILSQGKKKLEKEYRIPPLSYPNIKVQTGKNQDGETVWIAKLGERMKNQIPKILPTIQKFKGKIHQQTKDIIFKDPKKRLSNKSPKLKIIPIEV